MKFDNFNRTVVLSADDARTLYEICCEWRSYTSRELRELPPNPSTPEHFDGFEELIRRPGDDLLVHDLIHKRFVFNRLSDIVHSDFFSSRVCSFLRRFISFD